MRPSLCIGAGLRQERPGKSRLGLGALLIHWLNMATLFDTFSPTRRQLGSAELSLKAQIGLFISYFFAFMVTHRMASPWGGIQYFSLWYPAAGVRLALLWYCGARWTPVVIAEEVVAQYLGGAIVIGSPDFLSQLGGVARAPLSYGLIIGGAKWLRDQKVSELTTDPMPFGLAVVLAPTLCAFVAASWEYLDPSVEIDLPAARFATTFAAFLVGDLLGVLLVSPALLWLAARVDGSAAWPRLQFRFSPIVIEAGGVFAAGWVLATILGTVSPFLSMMPILVSATWMGLRAGRNGAWVAIAVAAVVVLPWSIPMAAAEVRIGLHTGLAAVAISAYLAGSYSEGQRRARDDLARRDRILFQAERLKTLRAMSVAVIHEISQPLSTLAIESRHLAAISEKPTEHGEEIRESAKLIERKAETLSTMVRRLRRFGGRAVDEPSLISMNRTLQEAVDLVAGEARSRGSRLKLILPAEDAVVLGQEVELTQALLNLFRNAIAASPGKITEVTLRASGGEITIDIANNIDRKSPAYGGMGIGSLVARAIIEAHGGRLDRADFDDALVTHIVTLPLVEVLHV